MHHALHAVHRDVPGNRLDVDRRAGGHDDGVVDRDVDAVVSAASIAVVLGLDFDPAGPFVDDDMSGGQLTLIASRALDRVDHDFVAGAGGHLDVSGDVGDADAAIAADFRLARKLLGLFGAAV